MKKLYPNIHFYKYQGCGNDFILIENINNESDHLKKVNLIEKICQRRLGIGADGVIFLERDKSGYLLMEYYNSDGTMSFCGNGTRCGFYHAYLNKMTNAQDWFISNSKKTFCKVEDEKGGYAKIEITYDDIDNLLERPNGYFINTGSPHLVIKVNDIESLDVKKLGAEIRYSKEYQKEGVCVTYYEKKDRDTIHCRTYERGVEDETLGCGTGALAAALVSKKYDNSKHKLNVQMKGGDYIVSFTNSDMFFSNITQAGPVKKVYKGIFDYQL